MTATQQDISNIPLAAIDVSDATLYQQDTWRPYFERLRAEDPVHWSENDTFGGFWSVTRFQDITAVDGNHEAFSSVPAITIGDYGDDLPVTQFIAMDPPIHDVQRAAVQGVVAPKNLSGLESLIRQRVGNILDELPVGETFNWVEKVSINLTTQMLATIFDFPFEDRHKLPYWSDMATSLPEIAGSDGDGDERTAALQDCLAYFTVLWHQRKHNSPDTMDLVSLLATNPHTPRYGRRSFGVPWQLAAPHHRRQRHNPQLHHWRCVGVKSKPRRVRKTENQPQSHSEHGFRDHSLANPTHAHASHRHTRY